MNERPQNKHLKNFVKGQSGNPSGRPKGLLTRAKVEATLGRFSSLTRAQLQEVVQDPASTMLEIMVASVMARAAKDGDASRLAFLLDRSIGKIKDMGPMEEDESLLEIQAMSDQELVRLVKERLPELEKSA